MNERIRQLRQSLELKQNGFAEKLGVTGSTISKIESGERGVSNQLINSICREWNVDEQWLRTGKGNMFIKLSRDEKVAELVAKSIKSDNDFLLNTFIALGNMSNDEIKVIENFVDEIVKAREENKKESN